MICVPNFKILNKLPSTPLDGEIALIEDTKQLYKYSKENGWELANSPNVNVSLYDINKQAIGQLPSLITDEQLKSKKELIENFLKETKPRNNYFMLYGKELGYFTIFKKNNICNDAMKDMIIECLQDLGAIQSIEKDSSGTAIECWIKNENGCSVLYLFNYDLGVIECSL